MTPYLKTKDFSVSQEEFELHHDLDLDMLVTKPHPEKLDSYYQSDNYISHTDASTSLVDKMYQRVKKFSIRRKVKLINRHASKPKTILDFGAGTGDFLLAAKSSSWIVEGVEPNLDARNKAKEKGVHLLSNLDLLEGRKYKVITLWHVLEHVSDLENQILNLAAHLEEQGTLIIAVPNFKSYDAKHYQEHWAAYDVPRHLWHFSKTAIEKLFAKQGLILVQTKPMIFDAFYVALLSEKYKSGKLRYAKAFLIGLLSNIKALSTKEHSSLIYILKKS